MIALRKIACFHLWHTIISYEIPCFFSLPYCLIPDTARKQGEFVKPSPSKRIGFRDDYGEPLLDEDALAKVIEKHTSKEQQQPPPGRDNRFERLMPNSHSSNSSSGNNSSSNTGRLGSQRSSFGSGSSGGYFRGKALQRRRQSEGLLSSAAPSRATGRFTEDRAAENETAAARPSAHGAANGSGHVGNDDSLMLSPLTRGADSPSQHHETLGLDQSWLSVATAPATAPPGQVLRATGTGLSPQKQQQQQQQPHAPNYRSRTSSSAHRVPVDAVTNAAAASKPLQTAGSPPKKSPLYTHEDLANTSTTAKAIGTKKSPQPPPQQQPRVPSPAFRVLTTAGLSSSSSSSNVARRPRATTSLDSVLPDKLPNKPKVAPSTRVSGVAPRPPPWMKVSQASAVSTVPYAVRVGAALSEQSRMGVGFTQRPKSTSPAPAPFFDAGPVSNTIAPAAAGRTGSTEAQVKPSYVGPVGHSGSKKPHKDAFSSSSEPTSFAPRRPLFGSPQQPHPPSSSSSHAATAAAEVARPSASRLNVGTGLRPNVSFTSPRNTSSRYDHQSPESAEKQHTQPQQHQQPPSSQLYQHHPSSSAADLSPLSPGTHGGSMEDVIAAAVASALEAASAKAQREREEAAAAAAAAAANASKALAEAARAAAEDKERAVFDAVSRAEIAAANKARREREHNSSSASSLTGQPYPPPSPEAAATATTTSEELTALQAAQERAAAAEARAAEVEAENQRLAAAAAARTADTHPQDETGVSASSATSAAAVPTKESALEIDDVRAAVAAARDDALAATQRQAAAAAEAQRQEAAAQAATVQRLADELKEATEIAADARKAAAEEKANVMAMEERVANLKAQNDAAEAERQAQREEMRELRASLSEMRATMHDLRESTTNMLMRASGSQLDLLGGGLSGRYLRDSHFDRASTDDLGPSGVTIRGFTGLGGSRGASLLLAGNSGRLGDSRDAIDEDADDNVDDDDVDDDDDGHSSLGRLTMSRRLSVGGDDDEARTAFDVDTTTDGGRASTVGGDAPGSTGGRPASGRSNGLPTSTPEFVGPADDDYSDGSMGLREDDSSHFHVDLDETSEHGFDSEGGPDDGNNRGTSGALPPSGPLGAKEARRSLQAARSAYRGVTLDDVSGGNGVLGKGGSSAGDIVSNGGANAAGVTWGDVGSGVGSVRSGSGDFNSVMGGTNVGSEIDDALELVPAARGARPRSPPGAGSPDHRIPEMGFDFLRNQSAMFLHGSRGTDPSGGSRHGEDAEGGGGSGEGLDLDAEDDEEGGVDLGPTPPTLGGGGDSGRFATQYTVSERSVGTTAPSEPYTSDDRFSQRGPGSIRGGSEHDYYDSGAPVQMPPRLVATLEHAQLEDGVDLGGLRRANLSGDDVNGGQGNNNHDDDDGMLRPATPSGSENSEDLEDVASGGRQPMKSEGQLAAEDALRAMGVFLNPSEHSPSVSSTVKRQGAATVDNHSEIVGSSSGGGSKWRSSGRKSPSVESFTPTDGIMSDVDGSVKSRSTEIDAEQESLEVDEAHRDFEAEYGPMEDYEWPEEFGEVVTISFLPGSIGMTFQATADGIIVTEVNGAAAWVGVEVNDFIVEVNGRVLPADFEDGELYEMLLELPRPVQV